MRQILCSEKECELLPSSQSSPGGERVNTSTVATGGLIPEPNSSSIPLSQARKASRKRKTKKTKKTKRSSKSQAGGRRKKPKRNQKGGKRKCAKGKRR